MRAVIAIAAAAVLAGFTVQDAEKALNGEWSGQAFAIGLKIDAAAKTARVVNAGKVTEGPFRIENVTGGAVTFIVADERFVVHVRNDGANLMFAPMGETVSAQLKRVR